MVYVISRAARRGMIVGEDGRRVWIDDIMTSLLDDADYGNEFVPMRI